MNNETPVTIGDQGELTTAENPNGIGRKTGDLPSFQGADGTGGSSSPGGSTSGGKSSTEKRGRGRPKGSVKSLPSASPSRAREPDLSDDETEAARAELESLIVELLTTYGVDTAESRFQKLRLKYPDAEARGMANAAILTETEKSYFAPFVVRLWRRFFGDKYLFTPDGICAVVMLKYFARNMEPFSACRKIEAELKAEIKPKPNAKPDDQRTELPSAARLVAGSNGNGKDNLGLSSHLQSSGSPRSDL
jgi:hypothetical protein